MINNKIINNHRKELTRLKEVVRGKRQGPGGCGRETISDTDENNLWVSKDGIVEFA